MIRKRLLVSLVAFTLSWAPAIAQAETRDGGSFREQLDAEFSKTGLSVRDVARRAVNVSPNLKVKNQD